MLRLPHLHKTTREFHAHAIPIETDPPLPISIDGEVLVKTPVTAKVAPRVIEVRLCPATPPPDSAVENGHPALYPRPVPDPRDPVTRRRRLFEGLAEH